MESIQSKVDRMVSNQSYYDLVVSNQSDFLDHFVKNYSGKEFTTEDLMKDKIIALMTLPPFPKEIYEKCKELLKKNLLKNLLKNL